MTTASIDIASLPQVTFGKTGERVPLLGLGTAPGGFGLADADAIALFERAIDLGVTYIDTAPGYERAQSQLSSIIPHCRRELFLVSKAHTAHYQEALDIVEKNLDALGTDHLDLMYVHSLGHLDVEQVLAKDGALAGLREAQRRGWTRYIGITAHHAPWKSAKVLREVEIDACMFAFSFVDCHIYNFEEVVLPFGPRPERWRRCDEGVRRGHRHGVRNAAPLGADQQRLCRSRAGVALRLGIVGGESGGYWNV